MADSPSPSEVKTDPAQTDTPASVVTPDASPENQIWLDRTKLQESITKLESEDNDFKRLFNDRVGRRAESKYKPQIEARDRELDQLRKELRRRDIMGMDEKELEAKFSSDADFAKEYAELLHFKPEPVQAGASEEASIQAAFQEVIEDAKSRGVKEDDLNRFIAKATAGGYDEDGIHWSTSLNRFQRDILGSVKTEINENLLKPGPDSSSSSRGTGSSLTAFNTIAEFKALPEADRKAIAGSSEGAAKLQQILKGE